MSAHLGRLCTAEAICSGSMIQMPQPNNARAQKELTGLLSTALFQNTFDQITIKFLYH